jgi:hypothetical protein
MERIEQAVFTSAQTERSAGYQVVATSPGVCECDARELAVWGPSHDALLETAPGAASLNFHPLPSGAYCVSRTTPAGWEYSGRGAVRVYTQCLIVAPAALARFANNPFALWRAALGTGALRQYEKVPAQLEPIELAGRASAVDLSLLARLCVNPGSEWLATLLQAALESVSLVLAEGPPAEQVIDGLLNCLPPACRPEFSFSTGLKFSSRRPFRLVALCADPEEQRRVERVYHLPVLRLSGAPPSEFFPTDSWPRLICRALRSGRASFLAAALGKRHAGFAPEDLSALGLQLLEQLEADALARDAQPPASGHGDPRADETMPDEDCLSEDLGGGGASSDPPPLTPARHRAPRAHAAHTRFGKTADGDPGMGTRPAGPSKSLDLGDRALLEKLERLDDLVFDAIAGNGTALAELLCAWPQLRQELDAGLLAESREQYLRYALSVWGECAAREGVRDPGRAIQSLDVLCMLFGEA